MILIGSKTKKQNIQQTIYFSIITICYLFVSIFPFLLERTKITFMYVIITWVILSLIYKYFYPKIYKNYKYDDTQQVFSITINKKTLSYFCIISLIYFNINMEECEFSYRLSFIKVIKISKKYNLKKLTNDDILYIVYCTTDSKDKNFLNKFASTPDYLIKRHRKQKIKVFI